jgi:hypothetical protein
MSDNQELLKVDTQGTQVRQNLQFNGPAAQHGNTYPDGGEIGAF